ncbi:hypothetical protein AX17_003247 [Amanita inopinata Kibby_2008]|nr:hypothetical protein AX17_003247 [Amanita inopinata Kibby_2008]
MMPGSLFPHSPTLEPQAPLHIEPRIGSPYSAEFNPGADGCVANEDKEEPSLNKNNRHNQPSTKMRVSPSLHHRAGDSPNEELIGKGRTLTDPCAATQRSGKFLFKIYNAVINDRTEQEQNWRKLEKERIHDKEKIRILEEEIKRLQEELSRTANDAPPKYTHQFPPPPPPPPPPLPAGKEPPSTSSDPSLLFISARAALKRAPVPVEIPINPSVPNKRQGLPTVGVPPDKMAAFLNEMKNVRLRKVSNGNKRTTTTLDVSPNTSSFQESSSLLSCHNTLSSKLVPSALPASHSTARNVYDSEGVAGAKRKRDSYECDLYKDDLLRKQRMQASSFDTQTRLSRDSLLSFSRAQAHVRSNYQTWPANSITELTTPSLCSDNEPERDDINPDDQLPRTPPASCPNGFPDFRNQHEIIDVDVSSERAINDSRPYQGLKSSPSPQAMKTSNPGMKSLFSRRPPTSPLPQITRRKLCPPSRLYRSPGVGSESTPTKRDDDELVSSCFAGRDITCADLNSSASLLSEIILLDCKPDMTRATRQTRERRRKQYDSPAHPSTHDVRPSSPTHKEHRTLDEELRHAIRSLEHRGLDIELGKDDSDVFLGAGIQEKGRNFLVHGGAGGLPISIACDKTSWRHFSEATDGARAHTMNNIISGVQQTGHRAVAD